MYFLIFLIYVFWLVTQGANQAAAAAKLGYPTHFVGQVGRDAYASMLRNALEDCQVDTSKLISVDGSSGIAFIMLQPGGENSIILVGGANTSEEWQVGCVEWLCEKYSIEKLT